LIIWKRFSGINLCGSSIWKNLRKYFLTCWENLVAVFLSDCSVKQLFI